MISFLKTQLFALSLLVMLLASQPGHAQWRLMNDDCALPARKRYFNIVSDEQPVTDADLDHPKKPSAKVPVPPRHATEVAQSQQEYDKGRYVKAAALLKPFVAQQLVAPQVLYHYARALYRVPGAKPQSYVAYQRLIALLDAYGRENDTMCAIYLPFCEAYYKLATLQMDNGKWELAAYNFSRFLSAINTDLSLKTNDIYESTLQYQTECFAELDNPKLCRHYGQRTLKFFPNNQYVLTYLARLPPLPKGKP